VNAAAGRLRVLLAGVRVVVLTTFELDEYVFEALHAGASGFLLKDIDPDDLRQAELAVLTGREREVLALVAAGLSNEEIGQRLFMSPATAKTHVSRAIAKLGVRDRAQLVVLAYQTGLVTPDQ